METTLQETFQLREIKVLIKEQLFRRIKVAGELAKKLKELQKLREKKILNNDLKISAMRL